VRLTLAGDKNAFRELVVRYQNVVFALALQHTADKSEAEDIAQESFLRAYRDLGKLRKQESFGNWLFGITLNVAREGARRRVVTIPLQSVPETALPRDDSLPRQAESENIHILVAKLPEEYRVPLTLHYVNNLKYAEIGRILGLGEVTARSRVHRARAMLKEMIEKAGRRE
jgi:RNA polymerase sigma-70 factor (ECF subfamily)